MEYFKANFFRWLIYAVIGAIALTVVIIARDWICGDFNEYQFYAVRFLKGFVVFCFLAPILDVTVVALSDKLGLEQRNQDDEEDDEAWFYQGYKNGMCVAEVVYRNIMTRGELMHKFTYVNPKGETITGDLFDIATEFTEYGYAQVSKDGKYNMIDRDGKYLCEDWYLGMANPDEDGCIKVMNDDHMTNFLDSTGKLMWEEWKKEL